MVEVRGDLRHNSYPGGDAVEMFTESITPLPSGSATIPAQRAELAEPVYP